MSVPVTLRSLGKLSLRTHAQILKFLSRPELESETESQNDSDTSSEPQPSTAKQQKNTTLGTKKVKKKHPNK